MNTQFFKNSIAITINRFRASEFLVETATVSWEPQSFGEHNFNLVYEAEICFPVEGMLIKCIAKDVTKAGIRAETSDDISPVVIFIARDHHFDMPYFSTINVDDEITARVIGQRFELNDTYISIIAELIEPKQSKPKKKKPFLVIK